MENKIIVSRVNLKENWQELLRLENKYLQAIGEQTLTEENQEQLFMPSKMKKSHFFLPSAESKLSEYAVLLSTSPPSPAQTQVHSRTFMWNPCSENKALRGCLFKPLNIGAVNRDLPV